MSDEAPSTAEHTTAYMREILTHHYMTAEPFPRHTALYESYVKEFVDKGLVSIAIDGAVVGNREPLALYMRELSAVPLPVKAWVMR